LHAVQPIGRAGDSAGTHHGPTVPSFVAFCPHCDAGEPARHLE